MAGYKHVPRGAGRGERRRSGSGKKRRSPPSSASTPPTSTRAPFVGQPGVVFGSQAKFHPRKYLAALAALIDGDGSFVFEA